MQIRGGAVSTGSSPLTSPMLITAHPMKCTRFLASRIENRTNRISRILKKTSAPKTHLPAHLRPTKSTVHRFSSRFIFRLTHVRCLIPSVGRFSRRVLFTASVVVEESVRFLMPA